jgi:hypothetical protein
MSSSNAERQQTKGPDPSNARPAVTLRFRAAAASTAAAGSQQEQQLNEGALPPWEKVLWRKQPYPDNYVDESFLQHMVRATSSSCCCIAGRLAMATPAAPISMALALANVLLSTN